MADETGTGSLATQLSPKPSRAAAKALAKTPGPWFILGAIVLAVITVLVGTDEPPAGEDPNRLATSLLQGITLIFGTVGSYYLGKGASREAAERRTRQHARSAFRRVLTLYGALGRLRDTSQIEAEFLDLKADRTTGLVSIDLALASLDKVRLMSVEQIATGEDALEDWRDLAPDDVARVELKARLVPDVVVEEVAE